MPAALPLGHDQVENDQALAAKAAGGCRSSFAALLDRHYDRIHRQAWRMAGSREVAEDIAQDVCVKLARALVGYRGDAAFSTWLHRITYTTALDHLRIGQRTVSVDPSDIVRLVDRTDSVVPPDGTDSDGLWRAVRALPPQQRDAVLLVYAEDMSHADAAEVMGCSEKTVSWHVHEAKKKLKNLLKVQD